MLVEELIWGPPRNPEMFQRRSQFRYKGKYIRVLQYLDGDYRVLSNKTEFMGTDFKLLLDRGDIFDLACCLVGLTPEGNDGADSQKR